MLKNGKLDYVTHLLKSQSLASHLTQIKIKILTVAHQPSLHCLVLEILGFRIRHLKVSNVFGYLQEQYKS